jgi:hypothetical protein
MRRTTTNAEQYTEQALQLGDQDDEDDEDEDKTGDPKGKGKANDPEPEQARSEDDVDDQGKGKKAKAPRGRSKTKAKAKKTEAAAAQPSTSGTAAVVVGPSMQGHEPQTASEPLPTQIAELEGYLTPRVYVDGDYMDDDFDEIMANLSMASSPDMLLYVTKQLEYIDAHVMAVQLPTYADPEAFNSLSARKKELLQWKKRYDAAGATPGREDNALAIQAGEGVAEEREGYMNMDLDPNVAAGE